MPEVGALEEGRCLSIANTWWDALYPRQSTGESRSKGAERRLERKKIGNKHKECSADRVETMPSNPQSNRANYGGNGGRGRSRSRRKKTQRQVFWYEGRGKEELDLRDRRN